MNQQTKQKSVPHINIAQNKQTGTTVNNICEDVLYHLCTFLNLTELQLIMVTCKIWSKWITYNDVNKWKLWYNALNRDILNIQSLDRNGESKHFIVQKNSFHSFDSLYHFAKFSHFSSHLLQCIQHHNRNDNILFNALGKINNHSNNVVLLFTQKITQNIINECNDCDLTANTLLTDPTMIFVDNFNDNMDPTNHEKCDEETKIDDNNNNDLLIRNNMKHIMRVYRYFLFCIRHKEYLKLLYLFENIIMCESRPFLRWFLFILDRSTCFEGKNIVFHKYRNEKKNNIGDIIIFMQCLEYYISKINLCLKNNIECVEENKYFKSHQRYLLQMRVDIDEIRSRGVSSLQHWIDSGSMICNPDILKP